MTRRFASLFVTATAFLVVASLADWNICFAQQFENPAATPERGRPEPVSLSDADESNSAAGTQHSILFEETASQIPALSTEPQTATTIQLPITGSPVADDPFESASGVRRVEGTGEEALGTYATSDNMPMANQNSDTNRNFGNGFQYGSRGQQTQIPPANQSSSLPPISSNGLRGSSLTPQATGRSPNVPNMRFGGRDGEGREVLDQQPRPPQADMNRPASRSSGQYRGLTQQPMSSGLNNNRFDGPPDNAPPIHSAPAGQWDNRTDSTQPRYEGQTFYDSNIAPTQYQQSANNNASQKLPAAKIDLSLARKIMTRYEIDNAPDPLPGRPVKLVEALQTTPQHLQKSVINQYWETFYDWATVLNSSQLANWLNQLPSPQNPGEIALLNAAKAAARNQMLADEIQLGKSQCKLQQVMGSKDDLLPLPSNQPLLQSYDTHYDWYESRNRLPEDLRGIDVMLSKSVQLIANRAGAVGTTRVALSQMRNGYAANPRELGSILAAARLWNEAEQDLVSSIVSYNQAIADYSLTISPGNTRPDQIVSMLIAKPKPAIAQQGALQTAGRTNRSNGPGNATIQNAGQSRFQNASQPQSQYNQSQVPGQSSRGYDRGDDPISRTMNSGSSLSPGGFSKNRLPNQPSNGRQPTGSRSQPGTFQSPPANQGQPKTFQPTPNKPLINPEDRSAFRGTGDQSFGAGNRSSFAPPATRGTSESAREFNSFGR